MTIDKAILRIEHSSMSVDDKETADFIIDIMRKYQQITNIVMNGDDTHYKLLMQIKEVIEEGDN